MKPFAHKQKEQKSAPRSWTGANDSTQRSPLAARATVGLNDVYERIANDVRAVSASPADGAAAAHSLTGQLLGSRYRVVRGLGSGAFSEIVLAVDTLAPAGEPNPKHVAVKMMMPDFAQIGIAEGKTLRSIHSDDGVDTGACSPIVQLLGTFFHREQFCLVLELLGDSLLHCCQPSQRQQAQCGKMCDTSNTTGDFASSATRHAHHLAQLLPVLRSPSKTKELQQDAHVRPWVTLEAFRCIAAHSLAALAYLRRKHLIHADIKPENILWELPASASMHHAGANKVKLVDLGNAMSEQQRAAYYDEFELQSLPYRAPEVLLGVKAFNCAIDVWSLGCVLAELLLLRPLFACKDRRHLGEQLYAYYQMKLPQYYDDGKYRHLYCSQHTATQVKPELGVSPSATSAKHAPSCLELLGGGRKPYVKPARSCTRAQPHASGDGSDCSRTCNGLRAVLERAASEFMAHNRSEGAVEHDLKSLVNFLLRLLELDPTRRAAPAEALCDPFLAPFFPFRVAFGNFGDAGNLASAGTHNDADDGVHAHETGMRESDTGKPLHEHRRASNVGSCVSVAPTLPANAGGCHAQIGVLSQGTERSNECTVQRQVKPHHNTLATALPRMLARPQPHVAAAPAAVAVAPSRGTMADSENGASSTDDDIAVSQRKRKRLKRGPYGRHRDGVNGGARKHAHTSTKTNDSSISIEVKVAWPPRSQAKERERVHRRECARPGRETPSAMSPTRSIDLSDNDDATKPQPKSSRAQSEQREQQKSRSSAEAGTKPWPKAKTGTRQKQTPKTKQKQNTTRGDHKHVQEFEQELHRQSQVVQPRRSRPRRGGSRVDYREKPDVDMNNPNAMIYADSD